MSFPSPDTIEPICLGSSLTSEYVPVETSILRSLSPTNCSMMFPHLADPNSCQDGIAGGAS